jgi:hypothetical protein
MKNPIAYSNLFKTPTSTKQLEDIAESMRNVPEAWMVMMFTLNYCHHLVEKMLYPDITEEDLAEGIRQCCIEMDADAYISAELRTLKQSLEAQAKRRNIKVTIKKPKHPVKPDPEAEEDRADYEREQLMRP